MADDLLPSDAGPQGVGFETDEDDLSSGLGGAAAQVAAATPAAVAATPAPTPAFGSADYTSRILQQIDASQTPAAPPAAVPAPAAPKGRRNAAFGSPDYTDHILRLIDQQSGGADHPSIAKLRDAMNARQPGSFEKVDQVFRNAGISTLAWAHNAYRESGGNPLAQNPDGSLGLFQMNPNGGVLADLARQYGAEKARQIATDPVQAAQVMARIARQQGVHTVQDPRQQAYAFMQHVERPAANVQAQVAKDLGVGQGEQSLQLSLFAHGEGGRGSVGGGQPLQRPARGPGSSSAVNAPVKLPPTLQPDRTEQALHSVRLQMQQLNQRSQYLNQQLKSGAGTPQQRDVWYQELHGGSPTQRPEFQVDEYGRQVQVGTTSRMNAAGEAPAAGTVNDRYLKLKQQEQQLAAQSAALHAARLQKFNAAVEQAQKLQAAGKPVPPAAVQALQQRAQQLDTQTADFAKRGLPTAPARSLPVHTGTYWPSEVQQDPSLHDFYFPSAKSQAMQQFVAPQAAMAEAAYRELREDAMRRGDYPQLPALSRDLATRQQQIAEKNQLLEQYARGGWTDLEQADRQRVPALPQKGLTPWQKTLAPILQKQLQAERTAFVQARAPGALEADRLASLVSQVAGGAVSGKVAGLVAPKVAALLEPGTLAALQGTAQEPLPTLGQKVAQAAGRVAVRAVSGAAGGAAGGATAAATGTALRGGSATEALHAALDSAGPGALFGAGAGTIGGVFEELRSGAAPQAKKAIGGIVERLKQGGIPEADAEAIGQRMQRVADASQFNKNAEATRFRNDLRRYAQGQGLGEQPTTGIAKPAAGPEPEAPTGPAAASPKPTPKAPSGAPALPEPEKAPAAAAPTPSAPKPPSPTPAPPAAPAAPTVAPDAWKGYLSGLPAEERRYAQAVRGGLTGTGQMPAASGFRISNQRAVAIVNEVREHVPSATPAQEVLPPEEPKTPAQRAVASGLEEGKKLSGAILDHLQAQGPSTPGEIAKATGYRPFDVVKALQTMEQQGGVRTDEDTGRAKIVPPKATTTVTGKKPPAATSPAQPEAEKATAPTDARDVEPRILATLKDRSGSVPLQELYERSGFTGSALHRTGDAFSEALSNLERRGQVQLDPTREHAQLNPQFDQEAHERDQKAAADWDQYLRKLPREESGYAGMVARLIKAGKPLENAKDYGVSPGRAQEIEEEVRQHLRTTEEAAPRPAPTGLSEDEQHVYALLTPTPQHADDLRDRSDLVPSQTREVLADLVKAGHAERTEDGQYRLAPTATSQVAAAKAEGAATAAKETAETEPQRLERAAKAQLPTFTADQVAEKAMTGDFIGYVTSDGTIVGNHSPGVKTHGEILAPIVKAAGLEGVDDSNVRERGQFVRIHAMPVTGKETSIAVQHGSRVTPEQATVIRRLARTHSKLLLEGPAGDRHYREDRPQVFSGQSWNQIGEFNAHPAVARGREAPSPSTALARPKVAETPAAKATGAPFRRWDTGREDWVTVTPQGNAYRLQWDKGGTGSEPKDLFERSHLRYVEQKPGEKRAALTREVFLAGDRAPGLGFEKKLYHGTTQQFEGVPQPSTAQQWGKAVYFATNPASPRDEFGHRGRVLEYYGDFRRPLVVGSDAYRDLVSDLEEESYAERDRLDAAAETGDREAQRAADKFVLFDSSEPEGGAAISQRARRLGYDAIIDPHHGEYGDEVAVLDTSTLKTPEEAYAIHRQRMGAEPETKPAETAAPYSKGDRVTWKHRSGEQVTGVVDSYHPANKKLPYAIVSVKSDAGQATAEPLFNIESIPAHEPSLKKIAKDPENTAPYAPGDRVTWTTSSGQRLTGTVRHYSSAFEGRPAELTVNADQIAHAGGVPIGRVEYVRADYPTLRKVTPEDEAKARPEATTPPTPKTEPAPAVGGWLSRAAEREREAARAPKKTAETKKATPRTGRKTQAATPRVKPAAPAPKTAPAARHVQDARAKEISGRLAAAWNAEEPAAPQRTGKPRQARTIKPVDATEKLLGLLQKNPALARDLETLGLWAAERHGEDAAAFHGAIEAMLPWWAQLSDRFRSFAHEEALADLRSRPPLAEATPPVDGPRPTPESTAADVKDDLAAVAEGNPVQVEPQAGKPKRGGRSATRRAGEPRAEQPGAADTGALETVPPAEVRPAGEERGVDTGSNTGTEPGHEPAVRAGTGGRSGGRGAGSEERGNLSARGESAAPQVRPQVTERAAPAKRGLDYTIADRSLIAEGGKRRRFDQNVEAIRLLKQLEAEGRLATPEEQEILVRYAGWGGLKEEAFKPEYYRYGNDPWKGANATLKELLTDAEYRSAHNSITNAHYTAPEVVTAMWDALGRLGINNLDHPRVLEPALGIGHFFGLMPPDLRARSGLVGVELDDLTGRIAKQLYQSANIHIAGFQNARTPNNFFDVVISNVPFSDVGVHDSGYDRSGRKYLTQRIHDYFFAKSLDKVRSGGVIAFITSDGTLDKLDPRVRKYLAERAELLGAIRLPNTAFEKNAFTSVTTDILFLRRRLPGEEPTGPAWTETQPLADPRGGSYEPMPVNEYYHQHPEMLLGQMLRVGTQYRGQDAALAPFEEEGRETKSPEGLARALQAAIQRLPADVLQPEQHPASATSGPAVFQEAPASARDGSYFVGDDGGIYQRAGAGSVKADYSPAETKRAKAMLGIRDAYVELLRAQVTPGLSDDVIEEKRQLLNERYDAFAKAHGPLSLDENSDLLDGDPDLYRVLSLEEYEKATQKATKAPIFSRRTTFASQRATSADTPEQAMLISLNETGRLDFARMSELTGLSPVELQTELGDRVYQDPEAGWVLADEYLSGPVRDKLLAAREAAATAPEFERNVAALEAVQPADLGPDQISTRLGAPWIPPDLMAEFVAHLVGTQPDKATVTYREADSSWTVDVHDRLATSGARAQTMWGASGLGAHDLVELALNQKQPVVKVWVDKNTQKISPELTEAARVKQQEIGDEFRTWLFGQPERTERMVRIYNDLFNGSIERRYDGSHLTLPGLTEDITPERHQKDAVWRVITSGNTLFGHEVGTGKTLAMAASAMELRRLGIARKPMIVIPNHMVGQITREVYRLYPGAKILTVEKGSLDLEKRQRTLAKIANDDWDLVVVRHYDITQIPIDPETEAEFYAEQAQILEDFLRSAATEREMQGGRNGKPSPLERKLAKEIQRLELNIQKLRDTKKDPGMHWEELGVDALFVDEAHEFKNLYFPTKMVNVKGVPRSDTKKTTDLYIKIQHLLKTNGGRTVVFATGTPIPNAPVAEAFTLLRYLAGPKLRSMGLQHFDAFAGVFAQPKVALEPKTSGVGYQYVTRLGFDNLPEMNQIFRTVADIKMIAMPEMRHFAGKRPAVKGGGNKVVEVEASPEYLAFVQELAEEAEYFKRNYWAMVQADPSARATMIVIMGKLRKASLDMRMVDPHAADLPDSKVNRVVAETVRIWKETAADRGAQIIFCDEGIPGKKGMTPWQVVTPDRSPGAAEGAKKTQTFTDAAEASRAAKEPGARLIAPRYQGIDLYADIIKKLVKAGIPREQIATIYDPKNDDAKEALFEKVRNGEVRVLLGSTQKMGTGTNVQTRLAGLHHVTVPYRPDHLEQREGRIIRRGNMFPEVEIINYVTKGVGKAAGGDTVSWGIIKNKSTQIKSVMLADPSIRNGDDFDSDVTFSPSQLMAIASGDPRLERKTHVDAQVDSLLRQQRNWERGRWEAQRAMKQLIDDGLPEKEQEVAKLAKDAEAHAALPDPFALKVKGATYDKKADAGKAILELLPETPADQHLHTIGKYGGFTLALRAKVRYVLTDEAQAQWEGIVDAALAKVDLTRDTYFGLSEREREKINKKIPAEIEAANVFKGSAPTEPVYSGDLFAFHAQDPSRLHVTIEAGTTPSGLMARLDNELNRVPPRYEQAQRELAQLQANYRSYEAEYAKPFAKADELAELLAEQKQLDKDLDTGGAEALATAGVGDGGGDLADLVVPEGAGTSTAVEQPSEYYRVLDNNQFEKVSGYPVEVPGLDFEFFAYRTGGSSKDDPLHYAVSEARTGQSTGATGATLAEARERAIAQLSHFTNERFEGIVANGVRQRGESPLFENGKRKTPKPSAPRQARVVAPEAQPSRVPEAGRVLPISGRRPKRITRGGPPLPPEPVPFVKGATTAVTAIFAPASVSPMANLTGAELREMNAQNHLNFEQAAHRLNAARAVLDGLPRRLRYEWIDRQERPERYTGTELDVSPEARKTLDEALAVIKLLFTTRLRQVQALGRLMEKDAKDFYMGRIWQQDPAYYAWFRAKFDQAREALGRSITSAKFTGRRVLVGGRTFLKPRSLPNFVDGLRWRVVDPEGNTTFFPAEWTGQEVTKQDEQDAVRHAAEVNGKAYPPLKPVYDNPIDTQLMKIMEMDRMIGGANLLPKLAPQGAAVIVPHNRVAPAGWETRDEAPFVIYGPPTVEVREAFDQRLEEQLLDFAKRMGFQVTRRVRSGGAPWGTEKIDDRRVKILTRFGGPESVLTHEIGHGLDDKYRLADVLMGTTGRGAEPKGINPDTKKRSVSRLKVRRELNALADLRFEGYDPALISAQDKAYVRDRSELVANLIHALVHLGVDRVAEVAPTVVKRWHQFLQRHPEVRPLMDVKPSLVLGERAAQIPVAGRVIAARWYLHPDAMRVMRNYLSPSLNHLSGLAQYRRLSGAINAIQLLGAGVHASFSALNGAAETVGLGMEQLLRGGAFAAQGRGTRAGAEVANAYRSLWGGVGTEEAPDTPRVQAVFNHYAGLVAGLGRGATAGGLLGAVLYGAPGAAVGTVTGALVGNLIQDLIVGDRVIRAALTDKELGPELGPMVRAIVLAGGRVKSGSEYFTHGAPAFMRAVRGLKAGVETRENLGLAVANLAGAAVHAAAWPVLGYLVPRIKVAEFAKKAAAIMMRNPNVPLADLRPIFQRLWDQMDNIFGLMVQDNRFWHGGLRFLNLALLRSPGWTWGSAMLAGNAVADLWRMAGYGAGRALASGGGSGGGGTEPPSGGAAGTGDTPPGGGLPPGAAEPVYLFNLTAVMAMTLLSVLTGAVAYYAYNRKAPQKFDDTQNFPTGRTKPNGRPELKRLKNYVSDYHDYRHDPVETLRHKSNPLLSVLTDLYFNRDYFNTEIRDPDATPWEQAKQLAEYLADVPLPLSLKNAMHSEGGRPKANALESILGVNPSPYWVGQTDAEKLLERYQLAARPQGATTKEQADLRRRGQQVVEALRRGVVPAGATVPDEEGQEVPITDEMTAGMTAGRIANLYRRAYQPLPPLVYGLQRLWQDRALSFDQVGQILKVATPEEKARLRPLVATFMRTKRGDPTSRWKALEPGKQDTFLRIFESLPDTAPAAR